MSKFKIDDRVRIYGTKGTVTYAYWSEDNTYDVRMDAGPLLSVVGGDVLEALVPPAPAKGSLVKIGSKTYLHGGDGFFEIGSDGFFVNSWTPQTWESIHQPGFKVATFN